MISTPNCASLDAYRNAVADGRISKARATVLNWMLTQGSPFSQADVCHALGTAATDFRRFGPRIRELERMDVIEKCGTKTDPDSGERVNVYHFTGREPKKLPPRLSHVALFRRLRSYLTRQVRTDEVDGLIRQIDYRL